MIFKKIFLFLALSYIAFAQVVYEPLHRDVYSFLSRLSQKSVIVFDDQVRPVSRKYIAQKLIEASEKLDQLTSLEKEELDFYNQDFKREFDFINNIKTNSSETIIAGYDSGSRLRLFGYRDNLFSINLSPILGIKIGSRDNEKLTHIWNGIYTYGYIDKYIGFSFDFRVVLRNISLSKTTENTEPIFFSLSTLISARFNSMYFLTKASPNPLPSNSLL